MGCTITGRHQQQQAFNVAWGCGSWSRVLAAQWPCHQAYWAPGGPSLSPVEVKLPPGAITMHPHPAWTVGSANQTPPP